MMTSTPMRVKLILILMEDKMNKSELIEALRRLSVETGSLACCGCGYEHSCGVHGCAIIKEAAERISKTLDVGDLI